MGDITTREVRGFAMGAFRTAGDMGFLLGPTFAGYMTDNVGVLSPLYIVTGLCLFSSAITFYALDSSKLRKIVELD